MAQANSNEFCPIARELRQKIAPCATTKGKTSVGVAGQHAPSEDAGFIGTAHPDSTSVVLEIAHTSQV